MGGGQRCCSTAVRAQDRPHNNYRAHDLCSAEAEKARGIAECPHLCSEALCSRTPALRITHFSLSCSLVYFLCGILPSPTTIASVCARTGRSALREDPGGPCSLLAAQQGEQRLAHYGLLRKNASSECLIKESALDTSNIRGQKAQPGSLAPLGLAVSVCT